MEILNGLAAINPMTNDKPILWIVIVGVAALAIIILLAVTKKKK